VSSGIYSIRFKNSNCVYVGRSVNPAKRLNEHLSKLRRNKHHNPGLQNHFNKYGEEDLIFNVEIECSREELSNLESRVYVELLDQGYTMLNCAGLVGQEVYIPRSISQQAVVYNQIDGQIEEWQTNFLKRVLALAEEHDILNGYEPANTPTV
jgi:group I intron endonuclease